MANATAERLTALHRSQQLTISRTVAEHILAIWGVVDPAAVDRSWRQVADAMVQIIEAGHAASVQAAAAYLHLHAALYGVDVGDVAVAQFNAEQVATSLRVTGPVALKIATGNGLDLMAAAATAATQLAGSSTRHALAGGRSTIIDTVNLSDSIIGYRRVGDGHSCSFCSMLISRGAVYRQAAATTVVGRSGRPRGSRQIGESFHDHCGCSTEPLYAGQDEPAEVLAAFERYLANR